jgi:hypothetical protein
MDFFRLAESLTCRFESSLVNLAITFDDVDLATGAVGKRGIFALRLGSSPSSWHDGGMLR